MEDMDDRTSITRSRSSYLDAESPGAEVQKKWKNLKGCFLREKRAQRKTVSGQGEKKRRKCIHFDELLFLVPFVKGRESSSNVSRTDNDEQERFEGKYIHHDKSDNTSSVDKQARPVLPSKKNKPNNVTTYETSLLNKLQAKQSDEVNEDKNFALMLVPMLGKLNEEQKHYAKVEILNVMRNARYFNPQLQPVSPESSRHRQLDPGQNYYMHGQTNNENLHSQNTGSLQNFYNDFSASIVSPSSSNQ